jgi:hypothetical protein
MTTLSVFDRLGEEINLNDRVKFRAWQGKNTFFTGTGYVQNIDPFGNIYIEPDSAMAIEGEDGSFDATVLMVTTQPYKKEENHAGGVQRFKAYKEHFSRPTVDRPAGMLGVSWLERIEGLETWKPDEVLGFAPHSGRLKW